ncbi:MAG: hypothetical protein H6510_06495 [Acidobacteria bacterium]|nr:hypothetical protein [Acidobacteriota bacterium]MCB9397445.1 hypothetical protein [Acidobacteriota bacterium]
MVALTCLTLTAVVLLMLRLLVIHELKSEANFLIAELEQRPELTFETAHHHPGYWLVVQKKHSWRASADWANAQKWVTWQPPSHQGRTIRADWIQGTPKILLIQWGTDYKVVVARRGNSLVYLTLMVLILTGVLFSLFLAFRAGFRTLIQPIQREWDHVQALDKAKEEFFAGIFHDLGTPLTSLMSRIEALLEEPLAPETAQQLKKIYLDAQAISQMTSDQLQRARFQSGTISLNLERIYVEELFEMLEIRLEILFNHHEIQLLKQAAPNQVLLADRLKLEQALTNLLTNSIKYGPHGQTLILRCEEQLDQMLLQVVDQGPGFPPERMQEWLQPFKSIGTHHLGGRESTGLGLYLVDQIARSHRGSLTFAKTDEGFVASICLPR